MKSDRSLLDVSVIIALFDPKHDFHDIAHQWWADEKSPAWASCPLTENGLIRIMSNANYHSQGFFAAAKLSRQFAKFSQVTDHEFWPDEISILDSSIFDFDQILGPGQITDCYLLALAVRNEGRLVTFDTGISMGSVPAAGPENLFVIC